MLPVLGNFVMCLDEFCFCSSREGFSALLLLNCRWALALWFLLNRRKGLSLCSRSSREGFSFLFHEEKKRNKENSPSALFCLLRYFSTLNKKNSLSLKQLFVFNAPKSTSASRQKSEAGPICFERNIASLVACGCLLSHHLFFCFVHFHFVIQSETKDLEDI